MRKHVEKLTEKELLPYVPYEVLVTKEDWDNYLKVVVVKSIPYNIYEISPGIVLALQAKLILRPMSDLEKKIEHNGKSLIFSNFFLSKTELVTIKKCLNFKLNLLDYISVSVFNRLCEYHFDVFGLIPRGLALDYNTQPEN